VTMPKRISREELEARIGKAFKDEPVIDLGKGVREGVRVVRGEKHLLIYAPVKTSYIPATLPEALAKANDGELRAAVEMHWSKDDVRIEGVVARDDCLEVCFGVSKGERHYAMNIPYSKLKELAGEGCQTLNLDDY